jgi:uncharacterized phage protein gp47/JayE
MPFERPSLTDLRSQAAADIAAGLPGVNALLRYSNLGVLGDVDAALANGLYGYLDWIAKQSVPFTATDEYLEGWAALKNVIRTAAGYASGQVIYNGTTSRTIPAGTSLSRADGATFTVQDDVVLVSSLATVTVKADTPGTDGNTPVGTTLSITSAISGVNSQGTVSVAIEGGTDVQNDDDLRTRMIAAYASPASGGSASDYVSWALAISGVTRAWSSPNVYGSGTVGVLFMMDDLRSSFGGFPQGTNGTAASETRAAHATGDQLTIANAIFSDQPVTALVYAMAPIPNTIGLTIAGLGASPATSLQNGIAKAVSEALQQAAEPGGVTALDDINSAIRSVSGTSGFVVTAVTASAGTVSPSPAGNITSSAGALPVLGMISYT